MVKSESFRGRRWTYLVGGICTASLVAACSSSSKGASSPTTAASSGSGTASSAGDLKDLGMTGLLSTSTARSGQTIDVQLVTTEQGAAPFPEFREGAMAMANYVNAHGGIQGAKLSISVCDTNATPEAAVACANSAIDHHDAAEFVAFDLSVDSEIPILSQAGIPVVLGISAGSKITTMNPDVTALNPSATALQVAPLKYAVSQGAKGFGEAAINAPTVIATIPPIVNPAAKALGVPVHFSYLNPSVPNYTSIVEALKAAHVDWIYGHFSEGGCNQFLSAAQSAGYSGHVIFSTCTQFITADQSAAPGTYVTGPVYPYLGDASAPESIKPQLSAYGQAMTAAGYPASETEKPDTQAGYAGMGNFIVTLQRIPTSQPITASSIKAALHSDNFTGFFGNQINCTGAAALPNDTASCSLTVPLVKVVQGGSNPTVVPVDGGLLDYGTFLKQSLGQ